MNEQKIKLSVRLNAKQHEYLKKQAALSGLKMEPFIRKLIMGTEIRPRPPDEYLRLIREINAIGNNINQIAHIANAERTISNDKINYAVSLVDEIMEKVRDFI